MFNSRGLNNKAIHKRALRIIYNGKSLSQRELLTEDSSVAVDNRNLKTLAIEIYKVIEGLSSPFLNEVLVPHQCNNDLRGNNFLEKKR